jgi:hypothetical protein
LVGLQTLSGLRAPRLGFPPLFADADDGETLAGVSAPPPGGVGGCRSRREPSNGGAPGVEALRAAARQRVPLGSSLYLLPSGALLPRDPPPPEAAPQGSPPFGATRPPGAADAFAAAPSRRGWTAESAAAAGAVGMVSRMQVTSSSSRPPAIFSRTAYL